MLIGGGERKQAWKDNNNQTAEPDDQLNPKEQQPMCKNINNHIMTNMEYYQHSWQRGMLTNGEYLLYLNFVAHRSFNDPTQYPIFPWIVQDFKYESLDLSNPMTYRDLGKPIGAHSPDKLDKFKSKYFEIINKQSTYTQFGGQ